MKIYHRFTRIELNVNNLRQKLLELMANTSDDSEEIDRYEQELRSMTAEQIKQAATDAGII